MNETEDWGEPATWDELWKKERELRGPIEAEYVRNVAPLRKRKDQGSADVELKYSDGVRAARSRKAQADREFRETTVALKRWRDSSLTVLQREYEAERRIHAEDRKRRLAPIQEWKDRQWKRLVKLAQEAGSRA